MERSIFDRLKKDYPLNRYFVYNNYVKDSVLGTQDYGGIEVWNGGIGYTYK